LINLSNEFNRQDAKNTTADKNQRTWRSWRFDLTVSYAAHSIVAMLFYLFLLFTLVPLVELAILTWIGIETKWYVPILIVIATGVAGAALSRWQGWQVLQRIREDARAGRVPADALIDGFLILLAGILLVTPGVLTDLVGVALLIPPVRKLVKRGVAAWIKRNIEFRVGRSTADFWSTVGEQSATRRDEIIDAKVIRTHVEDAPQ
jgi:UPF0716 protein FxsA